MAFHEQKVLPALRDLRNFEHILDSQYEYFVLLEMRISNLEKILNVAKRRGKKVLVHADLIQGLSTDDYAAEFICNDLKPAGIISTRSNMIIKAKAKGLLAIQRTFLLDTIALKKSYTLIERTKPDYIEVLPGVVPELIQEIQEQTGCKIISGGLIRTVEQVEAALAAGAEAVTTSQLDLWKAFERNRHKVR
ncbi:glycerol-3-phosphate responsive antiterminator [Lederbergia sp. NSJ-179]|uniref:glycerol-3-phosphate responsive antiterminator n=1 Tax=Lederbergia sp. NSJ-179 TaxID=2931402 RepID=UPI001FCFED65|nr:glycerol-3-phosphate responsive antiterminator [Lederbergia sp. NSJ-179]MCJ7843523.1 glycerol-3-phosphate responsive antiterminator [Lederbergia sp. NSJ-179]